MSTSEHPPTRTPPRHPHDALDEWELRVAVLNDPATRVCHACVTDPSLWASASGGAEQAVCGFCGRANPSVSLASLGVVVESAIDAFYVTVEESGAYRDDGQWSENVEDVSEIAQELLDGAVADDVAASLAAFVSDRTTVSHGFVRRRDVLASLFDMDEGEWRHFMALARGGQSNAAPESLHTDLDEDILGLFRRIERTAELNGLFKLGSPELWRCRPGPPEAGYTSGRDLGSPPAQFAGDGRLNAPKQSVFYGSTTLRGAAIEMANHGASANLWAGQFEPSRPLYHLDVLELPDVPSPFALDAPDDYDAVSFLSRFAETLREPWNDDPTRYRPTQIFAAYLLTRPEPLRPDAVKFASSVNPSSENWVVFADHEHCADLGAALPSADDRVFMLLRPGTTQFLTATDHL